MHDSFTLSMRRRILYYILLTHHIANWLLMRTRLLNASHRSGVPRTQDFDVHRPPSTVWNIRRRLERRKHFFIVRHIKVFPISPFKPKVDQLLLEPTSCDHHTKPNTSPKHYHSYTPSSCWDLKKIATYTILIREPCCIFWIPKLPCLVNISAPFISFFTHSKKIFPSATLIVTKWYLVKMWKVREWWIVNFVRFKIPYSIWWAVSRVADEYNLPLRTSSTR